METCTLDGCDRELNRDGLCFFHKMKTIRLSAASISRERNDNNWGIIPGGGTGENVRAMYEQRRKEGLPDPEPENKEAAAFAPARGVIRD